MVTNVFVSYSHDADEHKQWVGRLCGRLKERGIEAVLDQTHLQLGELITPFQKDGIANAKRVLVVCSDGYVKKIREHVESGARNEKVIIT